ncbi:hypothetical protein yinte0001_33620 [Yersinia intermedia ATCC 29909]|nr:hypothetical protein yinte0001_33620 [Yersinia intermedia ATCC 29909]
MSSFFDPQILTETNLIGHLFLLAQAEYTNLQPKISNSRRYNCNYNQLI